MDDLMVFTKFCPAITGLASRKNACRPRDELRVSALPPHLREQATIYLLDPKKGYYIARQGTNGFSTFVNRTEWEHAEFVQDTYAAISYDPQGSKIYLPAFFDVAEMRASGNTHHCRSGTLSSKGLKTERIRLRPETGFHICYLRYCELMVDDGGLLTKCYHNYMFYAPGVDNTDIGAKWDGHSPFAIVPGISWIRNILFLITSYFLQVKLKKRKS